MTNIVTTTDHAGYPVLFNKLDAVVGYEDGRVFVKTQGVLLILRNSTNREEITDYINNLY